MFLNGVKLFNLRSIFNFLPIYIQPELTTPSPPPHPREMVHLLQRVNRWPERVTVFFFFFFFFYNFLRSFLSPNSSGHASCSWFWQYFVFKNLPDRETIVSFTFITLFELQTSRGKKTQHSLYVVVLCRFWTLSRMSG